MLTTLIHLLILHVPENGFQDYIFHHLLRDQGVTDWLRVPQFLPVPFEDMKYTCICLSSSPQTPLPVTMGVKDYQG